MKIPFTLDAWLKDKSQKVVNSHNGKEVHLLEYDFRPAKSFEPMIIGYEERGGENLRYAESDLFIVTPEPELSEFEKACMKLYNEGRYDGFSGDKLSNESLKESASELLAIAMDELFANDAVLKEYAQVSREQGKADALRTRATELTENLVKSGLDKDSIPYHLIEFMCNLYTCQNWKEIEDIAELYATRLKAAAMKDLPRWKEYVTAGMQKRELSLTLYSGVYEVSDLFIDRGLYIPISELQKLPGFNDDSHE